MKTVRFSIILAIALFLNAARAYGFPDGPIKVIVPFSPGSTGDLVIRMIAPNLEAQLNTALIVENRPGAGGNMGTEAVVGAKPDGQTLLFTAMHNFVINQHVYKNMRFDPIAGLVPISKVVDLPYVMYVSGSSNWQSVKDVAKASKAKSIFFASSGAGTAPHLAGVLFSRMTGAKLTHVPYKGNPQSVQALLTDEVQLYFASSAAAQGHVGRGSRQMWPVAVAWDERLRELPNVPTTAEVGLPKLRVSNWWGLAAPAKTPATTINLLNIAVKNALSDPRINSQLQKMGMKTVSESPEEFRRAILDESAAWAQLIKDERIEAD